MSDENFCNITVKFFDDELDAFLTIEAQDLYGSNAMASEHYTGCIMS